MPLTNRMNEKKNQFSELPNVAMNRLLYLFAEVYVFESNKFINYENFVDNVSSLTHFRGYHCSKPINAAAANSFGHEVS